MTIQMILLPLFVEVTLTFVLWFWMAFARRQVFVNRTVHPRDIALGQQNWPEKVAQVSNSFRNQFELPVLFYVLTILSIITRHADVIFVVLAWIFVLSRIVHAYIHVTSNQVMQRGAVYGIGAIVLIVMWVIFMIRILLALP
jgi:hypothetical protein